jgi:hypothetical protein
MSRGRFRSWSEPRTQRSGVSGTLCAPMSLVQGADAAPTTQARAAFVESINTLMDLQKRWTDLKSKEVKSVNEKLRQANLPALVPEKGP